jgi:hypothetical protein
METEMSYILCWRVGPGQDTTEVCCVKKNGNKRRTPDEQIQSLEAEAQAAPEVADDFDVGVDEPVGFYPLLSLPSLFHISIYLSLAIYRSPFLSIALSSFHPVVGGSSHT